MRVRRSARISLAVVATCLVGCHSEAPSRDAPIGPENHPPFPIGPGTTHALDKPTPDGPISCDGCHRPTGDTFTAVRCDGCHRHPEAIAARLHLGLLDRFIVDTSAVSDPDLKAELRGAACYGCHPTGEPRAFSHTQIVDRCAECHAAGSSFAALPVVGLTHPEVGATDCSSCHETASWGNVSAAPRSAFDPTRDVFVDALQPTWQGTSILSFQADPQVLHMTMNHATTAVDSSVLAVCSNCHPQAQDGQFYPGVMHWSLAERGLSQPRTCKDCHGNAGPGGFSGPLDSRRAPSSGPMRHDAVSWADGGPTATLLLTAGCQVCHQTPDERTDAKWKFALGKPDAGAQFHEPLTSAGLPQPSSCLDCHANSRPVAPVSTGSATFDHAAAMGECKDCHQSTTHWTGAKYHPTAAATLSTCLPCHALARPTTTAGWQGNYTTSPFDYVTNVNGETHGAGKDCVVCHTGPGTGTWASQPNWQGGRYHRSPGSAADTTCILCHTTQRPDRLSPPVDPGFDHASNGTGDCFGCHQASVARGGYVSLLPIPGGDWRGGQSYPGDVLISTPARSVRVQSTALSRSGALVTGMTTTTVTLPNAFLHTSAAIPAALFPGPASAPDAATCWHCHTSTGTTVTSFSNGWFHRALDEFRATPASPITPLPQPTTCNDCHGTMRPPNIVSRTDAGTWVRPMDHAAPLAGGDCKVCHLTPGLGPTGWSDGTFHRQVPPGTALSECVSCHYPLITTSGADVTSPDAGLPSTFTMKHRSPLVTTQACASCHTAALAKSTTQPVVAALWKPGVYHPSLGASAQPSACLDCHAASRPTRATASAVVYALAQGGTATNGAQWMNHSDPSVNGKDCAICHGADAKVSGSAWSRTTAYHARVPGVTACARCHGLSNGLGSVVGTNNNLPAGLIDSATRTTSSAAPANTYDQMSHADGNVTRLDCNVCHDQVGPSSVPGVQGREWSRADFHRSFTASNPLIIDGTTARCSNCHMNVKPGAGYTRFDHSPFSAASAQDCSACHSWPGTNVAQPNWLGAAGAHAASGPTASSSLDCNTCHGQGGSASHRLTTPASSHYGGISNGNRCTSCHVDFSGFTGTVGNLKYAHTNATANSGGCVTCHFFAGQLYTLHTSTPALTFPTTPGGRQFSQTRNVTGSFDGDSFTANHTNTGLARCGACHAYATTTATTNVWRFQHNPRSPGITNNRSSSGCTMCH